MAEKGIFFRLARKDDYYEELVDFVASLRQEGRLVKTLKNGLALMWDLMNYKTDVLISLFPWVKEAFCEDKSGDDDIAELKRMVATLTRKVEQQQTVYIPQDASLPPPPAGYPLMKQAGQGIGKLASRVIAMPTFDEDEPDDGATIVLTKAANQNHQNNGGNLLSGIFGLD